MDKKDFKDKKYLKVFFISVIVLVIFLALYLFVEMFTDHFENTTTDETSYSISSLSCAAKNLTKSFFDLTGAIDNSKQEIKMTFKNDSINTAMYMLDVTYEYEKIAREKEASLHVDYDHFMINHGLNVEQISATFALLDLTVKIRLYAERNNINPITSELFLLDTVSYNYSSEAIRRYYEEKGFTCNYRE